MLVLLLSSLVLFLRATTRCLSSISHVVYEDVKDTTVFAEKHFRLFDTDNLKYDFHLRKESAAIGKADAETLPATDHDGLPRKKEQPAAGCFEYKEE